MSRLGVIADDFTGATDVAINLTERGFRTIVVTEHGLRASDERTGALASRYEAVVVALKTRTAPVPRAVHDALAAAGFLGRLGCTRFYDKYCSTFDSTPHGNIGPILDALADRLDARQVVVVPSFPANGRTVRRGLLRVNGTLLSESPMRDHPLTPMTRSRVAELLRPQTSHPVAELHEDVVRDGAAALSAALARTAARYVVVDAVTDDDLRTIASATHDHRLVSGASGIALGLTPDEDSDGPPMTRTRGRRLILSGSASAATRAQVDQVRDAIPSFKVDGPAILSDPAAELTRTLSWITARAESRTVMVYAVDGATDLSGATSEQSAAIERHLGSVAAHATRPPHGFTQVIVAGGETSGAIVGALGADALVIGPEIAPGVCWTSTTTHDGEPVNLALKSGNFGAVDMFGSAWEVLGT